MSRSRFFCRSAASAAVAPDCWFSCASASSARSTSLRVMIRSFTWTTTSSTTVPFGVIAGVTGSVTCGCGAFGALNGLWYRGACACTTPGSASRPSPHITANCEILKVIVTRILGQTSASTSAIQHRSPGTFGLAIRLTLALDSTRTQF